MAQDPNAAPKQAAAERAVDFVQSGMIVGLGTGSTAIFATRRIGALLREGALRDITGFATSKQTDEEARKLGIPMLTDDLPKAIDVTIDGADEVDPQLNLIKGGGGALLREKIVAEASAREIIVVDESKLSPVLGTRWPLPIEVMAFGWRSQARYLESLGGRVVVPGFNDAHDHISGRSPGVFVSMGAGVRDPSASDVLDSLEVATDRTPPGTWIRAEMWISALNDGTLRRSALDRVAPYHPVMLFTPFGHGFILNTEAQYGPNPDTFGHSGAGGSYGIADPARRLAIGYTMNQMQPGLDPDTRGKRLLDAVYACL